MKEFLNSVFRSNISKLNRIIIRRIGEIVQNRQAKPWLHPDVLFRLSSLYKEHQHCIDILHGFSYRVIRERKAELSDQNNNNNNNNNDGDTKNLNLQNDDELYSQYETLDFPRKKRLAFLDLLIEASQNGTVLTDEDIREEVDTFMFEVCIRTIRRQKQKKIEFNLINIILKF